MPEGKIKLFLSHASEDKDDFVRPLRDRLDEEGFNVWYDEEALIVGQSLLGQISAGLKSADYGIVVLSPHFFAKKWTQAELDGLFTLETAERKIIIPVWHNLSEADVAGYSPIIAARKACVSSQGLDRVVADIVKATAFVERQKELDPVKTLFATLNQTAALKKRSDQLRGTVEGAQLVLSEISNLFAIFESKISEIRGELPLPVESSPGSQPRWIMVQGPGFRESNAQRILTLSFEIKSFAQNSVAMTTLKQTIYFENSDLFGHFLNMGLIEGDSYSPAFFEDDKVMWLDKERKPHESAEIVSKALETFGRYAEDVLNDRQIRWQSV